MVGQRARLGTDPALSDSSTLALAILVGWIATRKRQIAQARQAVEVVSPLRAAPGIVLILWSFEPLAWTKKRHPGVRAGVGISPIRER
jgi:hypothetical protein